MKRKSGVIEKGRTDLKYTVRTPNAGAAGGFGHEDPLYFFDATPGASSEAVEEKNGTANDARAAVAF